MCYLKWENGYVTVPIIECQLLKATLSKYDMENAWVRAEWKSRKLNLKEHDLNYAELDVRVGRIQIGDSVYMLKEMSVLLLHIFYSKHLLIDEKVFLKNLRDSAQMQCLLKTSLDFLICTQIIPQFPP